MKRLTVLATLLLVLGCATGASDDETSLLSSATEKGTTTDFDVTIEQTNQPVIVSRDQDTIDIRYKIAVLNGTAAPVTLERISLSSTSSAPIRLATTVRQFGRTIAPGAIENVDFWVNAAVSDYTQGNRLPLTIRARTTFREASGKSRVETFTRRVAALYTVGVAR